MNIDTRNIVCKQKEKRKKRLKNVIDRERAMQCLSDSSSFFVCFAEHAPVSPLLLLRSHGSVQGCTWSGLVEAGRDWPHPFSFCKYEYLSTCVFVYSVLSTQSKLPLLLAMTKRVDARDVLNGARQQYSKKTKKRRLRIGDREKGAPPPRGREP